MKRRTFLKTSLAVGATLSLPGSRVLGANDDVRIGVIGIGSFVKIGGKGRGDVRDFRELPGVRVAALCDCDADHLGHEVDQFAKRSEPVKAFADFRNLLEDPNLDAVSITTPNHWHSLMAIMACQAGKDVFVQKPMSHNLFEGRKVVEAMRKYNRIVQATHGPRNSGAAAAAFQYARDGNLGKILYSHGLNYRPRTSIGKVDGPQPIPASCDYDLWCGPAPTKPLVREYLHYDWHWDWDTGSGDLGNMGIHYMDACRWALGENRLPKRVVTLGGRLGYDDDGQTPNTLVTLLDYDPAPIIFEVRGLPKDASFLNTDWKKKSSTTMDSYRDVRIGTIVHCEGGYVAIGSKAAGAYENDGHKIKEFTGERDSTKQNFVDAMKSRDAESLHTDALQGHLSCGLVHLTNISHRIGRATPSDAFRREIQVEKELGDAVDRMRRHLGANRIDLDKTPLAFGPVLTLDPKTERFVGPHSDRANALVSRDYRKPFVVPENV